MKLIPRTLGFRLAAAALLAACAVVPARADYQSTVLSQGPVGYWRLNETTPVANLSTIATNLGSLGTNGDGGYFGDLAGRSVAGAVAGNAAAHFDASVEYEAVTLNSLYAPGDFSAECWVAPDQNSANLQCMIGIGDTAAANRRGWIVYLNGGGANTFQLRLYTGSGTGANTLTATTNYTAGNFYHLAVTRSNALFRLYVNGVYFGGGTPGVYGEPAAGSQFTVGTRPGPAANLANMFPGKVDEAAYYTNVLNLDTIKAHFDAATTNAAGYRAQILAANPVVYLRLDEPPLPISANSGTLGSAAAAKLVYPAVSGDPGATPPSYPGLESTNVGVAFSGSSGSKLAGGYVTIPALNLKTNTVTFTCWIKPNGSQAGLAGAIMHRAKVSAPDTGTSAGLVFDAGGGLNLSYNWDGDDATFNAVSGVSLNDGVWNFAALIIKPDSATLFVPNGPNPIPSVLLHTHGALGFEGTTWFGTDGAKSGFNGSIDEVAIFKRALSLGEVYSQYAGATGTNAPVIFLDPQAPASSPYAGDTLTLTVDAGGTLTNFTYQWRKNSTPIGGATASAYTTPVLVAGGPDNYDVVITNNFGTVTSAAAAVTVQAQVAPAITQDVLATNRTLYAGGAIKLSVLAAGGGLTYQWTKGGTNLASATNVLGVTTASLNVGSLVASNAGTYALVISNAISAITSAPVVIGIATPGAGTYEALVGADGPVSWWRLDDATGSPLMLDAMGNADGFYLGSGATMGTTGALTNDLNKAATFASGGWGEVTNLPPQANTGDFSYECWVRTSDLITTELCPFSTFRPAYGFWFQKDTGGTWRGRDGYGDLDGNNSRQALIGDVTAAQWTHLVGTVASGSHRLYLNGRLTAGPFVDFCRNLNTPMRIGALDPFNLSGMPKFFIGDIDEVAVYGKALTDNQILAHYLTAIYSTNGAPFFKTQPTSQTVFIGATATFATLIEGSPFVGQQWYKNGIAITDTNNVSRTNATLSLANVSYADAIGATYYCVATNFVGSTTSSVVTLTVLPQPAFANLTNNLVLHLRFDGDYSDSSGHGHGATAVGSPTITAGKVGSGAVHYSTITTGSGGHGGAITSSDYLTLGSFTNGSDLSFSNNISFSVAYWVKGASNGYSSGDLPFFSSCQNSFQNGATTYKGINFAPSYNSSTAGAWSWSLADGSTAVGLYGAAGSINATNAASQTLWHHLVHTFNRTSGSGITYLDGLAVNTTGFSILDNLDSGLTFNIGQDPTGLYNETGIYDLDDLCVWKGRVLSSTEAYSAYYIGNLYGRSVDGLYPITITVTKVSGVYWLVWQGGTLQQATNINGPWTPVGATAPYYQLPLTGPQKFYKVSP